MKNEKKEKFSLRSFKEIFSNATRLAKIIWPEKKGLIVLFSLISFISSIFPIASPAALGLLINELVKTYQTGIFTNALIWYFSLILVVYTFSTLIYVFHRYLNKLLWLYLEEKVQLILIKKQSELDVDSFENPKDKDLFQKIYEEGVWKVQELVERMFFLMQRFVELVFAAVALSFAEWWMFLIVIVGIIPAFIIRLSYGDEIWTIHNAKAEIKRKYWHLRSKFESVESVIELKVFQNTFYFFDLIKNLFSGFQKDRIDADRKQMKKEVATTVFSQLCLGVAYLYLVFKVVFKGMQIGSFSFFVGTIGALEGALYGLFWVVTDLYQESLFVTDFFKFLDIENKVKKPESGIVLNSRKTPEIVFENVSFSYPGSDEIVLKDINLKITSGEKIALVGVNGAGKTTLIKLLCRFYDPTKGRILIDGKDLREIDIESYYSLIGALFQEYSNYRFLVKEAIAIGRTSEELNFGKVGESADKSDADDFIEKWQNKYDQQLGKEFTGGVEPSIGQWQKLSLARAFYRDPKIYILDEPTSSIDAQAEAKIFEKLEKLSKDKTVILISHRFSTVRKANRIIVIENGEITENGSHEELLKKNKTYARLFKLQAKGYQ